MEKNNTENQPFREKNPNSRMIVIENRVRDDASGLFSYNVVFCEPNIHTFAKNANYYLKTKFESEDISDFNGRIEINAVLPCFDPEKEDLPDAYFNNIADEDVVEKIKAWIDVTGKDFTVIFSIKDKVIRSFTLTEKTIRAEAKNEIKNAKNPGCFSTLLKFSYYSLFYGGGLVLFYLGIRVMQEERVTMGIRVICFAVLWLSAPSIISFLAKKIRKK